MALKGLIVKIFSILSRSAQDVRTMLLRRWFTVVTLLECPNNVVLTFCVGWEITMRYFNLLSANVFLKKHESVFDCSDYNASHGQIDQKCPWILPTKHQIPPLWKEKSN